MTFVVSKSRLRNKRPGKAFLVALGAIFCNRQSIEAQRQLKIGTRSSDEKKSSGKNPAADLVIPILRPSHSSAALARLNWACALSVRLSHQLFSAHKINGEDFTCR